MKRTMVLLAAVLLCLSLCACGRSAEVTTPEIDPAAYSADEEDSIAAFGDDLVEITDDTFAETVSEMIAHVGEFTGIPYRMTGVYKTIDGMAYLTRTVRIGGEETELALPLQLLMKEYSDGDVIEVVGIASTAEIGGETQSTLDVIAVKALEGTELAVPEWDGEGHDH